MAGLTNDENVKKALILLNEAKDCVREVLTSVEPGHSRVHPFPELRQVQRSLHRAYWDLEHCWDLHPHWLREYTWHDKT